MSLDSSKIHQAKSFRLPKSAKIACQVGKMGQLAQAYRVVIEVLITIDLID